MKTTRHTVWGLASIALILCYGFSLKAQSVTSLSKKSTRTIHIDDLKPLRIGDKIPNLEFDVINAPSKKIKLSDYKGKVIILDFWATWCTSCIKHFSKLDSFQTQLNDKLQVILVNSKGTGDDAKKLSQFFDKWKKNRSKALTLPSTVNDSIAEKLFPHQMVPHYVWVDASGTVRGITGAEEITKYNMNAFAEGRTITLREKKDLFDFDYRKPLFVNGNGGTGENVMYRSQFSGFLDGVAGMEGGASTKEGLSTRVYCLNLPILMMYARALPQLNYFAKNRIILNVEDHSKFLAPEDLDNWKYENTYCYELITPPIPPNKVNKIMKDDLDRFFNLETRIEKRKVQCYILVLTDKNLIPFARQTLTETNLGDDNQVSYFLHNGPISILVNTLNLQLSLPILDETGITQNISIDLPENYSNPDILKKVLAKYGLGLKQAAREVEMFVVNETKD